MAITIPTYDAPAVREKVNPSPAMGFQQSQAPSNPIPAGIVAAGKGMTDLGNSMTAIAVDMNAADAKAELVENMGILKQKRLDLHNEIQNTTGEAAFQPDADGKTFSQRKEEEYNVLAKELQGKMKFPAAQTALNTWSQEQYFDIAEKMNKHAFDQKKTTLDSKDLATIQKGYDLVASMPTDQKLIDETITDNQAVVYSMAQRNGWSKEVRDEKMAQAVSGTLRMQLENLDSDPPTMAKLYDQYKADGLLVAKDVKDMSDRVTNVKTDFTGKAVGLEVFNNNLPTSINVPIDENKVFNDIESRTDLTEKEKKKAEQYAATNIAKYKNTVEVNHQYVANEVAGLINKKASYHAVVDYIDSAAEGNRIDEKTRSNLLDFADRKYKISEGISEAKAEAKQAKALQQLSNMLTFQQKYMRGDYGTLSPAQVAEQFPGQFGGMTDNAMQFVNNVNLDLGKAKVMDSELNDMVRILKQNKQYAEFLPNMEKQTDVDKAKMALLQQKVIEIKSRAKDAPGKEMSTQQALLKAIEPYKTDVGTFFNTREPAYLIGSEMSTKYGKNPGSWPKDTQNRYISEQFYKNPANKGKLLTFKMIDAYRKELSSGGE